MTSDEYVDLRLAHGSECAICPLNGQRKVGKEGPVSASVYGIAEAPGEDEERWGARRGAKYGTPLVGKSGYRMRIENLVPAGLATLEDSGGRYPRIKLGDVCLLNTILCRPPGNDIESADGKKAKLCCENSLKWFLRAQLAVNPARTIVTVGATSTSVLRGRKTKIDAHRGRVQHHSDVTSWMDAVLQPRSEADILKVVLRGRKPKEEWWPAIEWFIKGALTASRASLKKCAKQSALAKLPPSVAIWALEWKRQVAKQRAALKKRALSTVKDVDALKVQATDSTQMER